MLDLTALMGGLAGPIMSPAGHRFDHLRETWISLFVSNMTITQPWNETHMLVVAVKEKDVAFLTDEAAPVHFLLVEKAVFYPKKPEAVADAGAPAN